jgi:hypothetical protein
MSTTPPYTSIHPILAGKTALTFDFEDRPGDPLHGRAFEERSRILHLDLRRRGQQV